jgi:hypothetical protein
MFFVTIPTILSFVILARLASTTIDFLVAVIVAAPTSLQLTIGVRRHHIRIPLPGKLLDPTHNDQRVYTQNRARCKVAPSPSEHRQSAGLRVVGEQRGVFENLQLTLGLLDDSGALLEQAHGGGILFHCVLDVIGCLNFLGQLPHALHVLRIRDVGRHSATEATIVPSAYIMQI